MFLTEVLQNVFWPYKHWGTWVKSRKSRMAHAVQSGTLRFAARKTLLQCVRDADLACLRESLSAGRASSLVALLRHCRESAMLRLLQASGGAVRLLLVVSEGLDGARLAEEVQRVLGDRPSMVRSAWPETILCYEAERLAPLRIVGRLFQSRPDCHEMASRLHRRIDVNW